MSFGMFNPSVKNLLPQANDWKAPQTFTKSSLGATPIAINKYRNTTPAAAGAQQVSPSTEWEGQGWKTNSTAASQSVRFDQYLLPVQGAGSPLGIFKTRFSINNAAYTDILELYTTIQEGISFPSLKIYGMIESSVNNSSTIGTLQNLLLTNPSGSKTNIAFKFGSTLKAGIGVDSSGNVDYKALQHNFFIGSTPDSSPQVIQIYSGGFYNSYSSFNNQKVTAGTADTGATVSLSTYGGFASKGTLVTGTSYTFDDSKFHYLDADNANECSGTATACNTYLTQGNCNAHTGAGCSWFSGNACSDFNGSSEGTCEGNAGCTWEENACSGQNNTDQSACEGQDDTYGGNCSWDTSTCPAITDESTCNSNVGCTWNDTCSGYGDQSSCESNSCTWNYTDCSISFFDESSCNAQGGCSWDGATCNGQFNTSCTGGNCSGNLCTGNYATGNCTGTYGAACQGTASCSNLTDDGETLCEAESGCTWVSSATYSLPSYTIANRNNTSREYVAKNIGATATINLVAGAGDTLESSIALAPGQSVHLHHYRRSAACSAFSSQGACTPNVGCSWTPLSCSSFGDESSCNAQSGNGCTWNSGTSACEGTYSGSSGDCSGNYTVSSKWYKNATIPA